MRKAFFFDRDGVLNHSIYRYEEEYGKMMDCAPLKLDELKINDDAKEIIEYIKSKGFFPIVITKQPDFLKKDIFLKNYEKITSKICEGLELERSQIFECLHKEGISLECECRKPKPGLIFMAKGLYDLDLENSWLVGDSWKDIKAAFGAEIKNTIFLKIKKIDGVQAGNEQCLEKMNEMNLKPKYLINELVGIKNCITF